MQIHLKSVQLLFILYAFVSRSACAVNPHGAVDLADNEFAEFEDMDEIQPKTVQNEAEVEEEIETEERTEMKDEEEDMDEAIVEDDVDEFAHLQNEDEFENFDRDRVDGQEKESGPSNRRSDQPQPLKFADVPAHFRSNWTNYQVELLVLAALFVYVLNYIYGKTRNHSLAYAWFEEHKELLEQQFALVGDDGTSPITETVHLIKDTDSTFSIWCSGRIGCHGMLIQLKLLKRQDLVGVISQLIRPKYDRIIVKVELEPNEMDSFIMALGQRKSVVKLYKEMTDLSLFTSEKKNADKLGLPSSFCVFSEIAEATSSMLDPRIINGINKYEQSIDYLHFSDQYCGVKPQEGESQARLPETAKVLIFSFNIPGKLAASDKYVAAMTPLMNLVFYCVDKVRRYRVSKEGKQKADKNRQSAQEAFLKTTHQQRQEAAQARREEKTRERKQKLMEEEDPEKQRRLEKQEQKRESRMKQPKVKQLKMKQ